MAEIAKIIQEKTEAYGRDRKALIPILQGIVAEKNYVDNHDMVSIARALDISAADVYGTASFYSFIENEGYPISCKKSLSNDLSLLSQFIALLICCGLFDLITGAIFFSIFNKYKCWRYSPNSDNRSQCWNRIRLCT